MSLHFRASSGRGQLDFFRSQQANKEIQGMPLHKARKNSFAVEHPTNTVTSLLGPVSINGGNGQSGHAIRAFCGGRLLRSTLSRFEYFLVCKHRVNQKPTLPPLHMILQHKHSDMCREPAANLCDGWTACYSTTRGRSTRRSFITSCLRKITLQW